jgi:hypothetical protein
VALVLADRVQQTGTANTTVSFTLSGSVTGFQSFAVVGNGNTTYYSATDASGNWEVGIGTYSTAGPTLTRTTILSSSNSGSAVTFSGTVSVLLTYPSSYSVTAAASGSNSEFASGTALLFQQTAAPTGWTKSTANDNAALRIVSGSASTGGSVNFTTAFASQAVAGTVGTSGSTTATNNSYTPAGSVGTSGATTLSTSQMPSHGHEYRTQTPVGASGGGAVGEVGVTISTTGATGGDGSHTHSGGSFSGTPATITQNSHTHTSGAFTGTAINLAVKYVDVIMATKN